MSPSSTTGRILAPVALALALVTAGCASSGAVTPSDGGSASGTTAPTVDPAGRTAAATDPAAATDAEPDAATDVTFVADPPPGAVGAPVGSPASLSVTGGTLREVAVSSTAGALDGATSDDGASWMSLSPPMAASTYDVAVTVALASGKSVRKSWQFTTGAAATTFKATVTPSKDAVVGVGMPVVVKLTAPVPETQRAAFESHLDVRSFPAVTGAWHWFSPTELHWRPHEFWVPGTHVAVDAKLAGVVVGGGAAGEADVTATFSIGDSHVSIVDATQHVMVVTVNGTPANIIPVSLGRDKYPTHSGTHVVTEKMQKHVMTSAAIGIAPNAPGGYSETVYWDVRISNSGEFVHAAPWSTGSQGRRNVSHGCVNVSTENAKWFYALSQPGDVVTVIGTPLRLQPTNGLGDWEIPDTLWANGASASS
jgi:lipoprotein-anchoring transpeptidase ErfK/SrfK